MPHDQKKEVPSINFAPVEEVLAQHSEEELSDNWLLSIDICDIILSILLISILLEILNNINQKRLVLHKYFKWFLRYFELIVILFIRGYIL